MSNELESPKELAARIGWPERRLRKLVAAKRIRHLRVGVSIFFPPNAIEDFIKANTVEPYLPNGDDCGFSSESGQG